MATDREREASVRRAAASEAGHGAAGERPSIRSVSPQVLDDWFGAQGLPAYRRRQLDSWLRRQVTDLGRMTDLPRDLRERLARDFYFPSLSLIEAQAADDGQTVKYLLELDDGARIETVSMRYRHGHSVCVSSQVGCRMGCTFCASALTGFVRNLSADEMLLQLQCAAAERGERVDNVVVMGIGEPFDNYDAVLDFLRLANEPEGLNIGMRHMTVSSCGLVPEIRRFADEQIPVSLAISLHAADDATRRQLLPVARRWPLQELMAACRYYLSRSTRRLSYEYALFRGVNDRLGDADALAQLLRGQRCHVNLIAANVVEGTPFQASTPEQVEAFRARLEQRRIPVTLRRALGGEIEAACGQLRRSLAP